MNVLYLVALTTIMLGYVLAMWLVWSNLNRA
jgi:hypothetical protein